jgi:hypothetical protein
MLTGFVVLAEGLDVFILREVAVGVNLSFAKRTLVEWKALV